MQEPSDKYDKTVTYGGSNPYEVKPMPTVCEYWQVVGRYTQGLGLGLELAYIGTR